MRGRGAQLAQGGAAQGLDVGLPVEQGVEEVVALDVNGVADVGVVGLEQTPFLAGGVRQGELAFRRGVSGGAGRADELLDNDVVYARRGRGENGDDLIGAVHLYSVGHRVVIRKAQTVGSAGKRFLFVVGNLGFSACIGVGALRGLHIAGCSQCLAVSGIDVCFLGRGRSGLDRIPDIRFGGQRACGQQRQHHHKNQ